MEYIKIRCGNCKNSFNIYNSEANSLNRGVHCPHCLKKMDEKQKEMLFDAFLVFSEVNKDFRKYHDDRGETLFQAEFKTKFVKPSKICLD